MEKQKLYTVTMYEGDYAMEHQPFYENELPLDKAVAVAAVYEKTYWDWLSQNDLCGIVVCDKDDEACEEVALLITRNGWYLGEEATKIANMMAGAE